VADAGRTRWIGRFGLVACLGGVGCSVITSTVDEIPDLSGEWADAQRDIAALAPPAAGNPYGVTPSQFLIETEERPFYCADYGIHAVILVKGCFRAEAGGDAVGLIRYVPDSGNLRHEARHAILFALGDERWPHVGH